MNEKLTCGAGKACITPDEELIPHLRGLAGQRFCTVADDLYVRAIAFSDGKKDLMIVSFELDKVPYPSRYASLIAESTGIPEENILLLSVHTHCAPITGNRPDEGPNDRSCFPPDMFTATEKYEKQLEAALTKACAAAVNAMQPCRIGWSQGESYINVNRSQMYEVEQEDGSIAQLCSLGVNMEAKTDHTVFVMKAESLDGETIAMLVNYPVHCCVMIGNDFDGKGAGAMTGDLAGRVSAMLEEKYGGVALWTSGAAGDVNPLMLNQYYYPDPMTGSPSELSPHGYDSARKALDLQSCRHMADIAKVLRTLRCETSEAAVNVATGWSQTPGRKPGSDEPGEGYQVRVRMAQIGDLIFAGISGELYSSIGAKIQSELPAARTVILNHESSLLSNAGYIFDDETLAKCKNPRGNLPGLKETRIVEGYVETSLLDLCKSLYSRLEICQ